MRSAKKEEEALGKVLGLQVKFKLQEVALLVPVLLWRSCLI